MLTDKQIVKCLIGLSDPMEVQRIGAMPIISEFAHAIEALVRAECVPQWISVADQMPASGRNVEPTRHQGSDMTKPDLLELIKLLSALESWGFSNGKSFPDYLHEMLLAAVNKLSAEVLK